MKAVVVGAGGFVGRELTGLLERRGDEVVALSSRQPGGIDPVTGLLPEDFTIPAGTETVFYLAASPLARGAHNYPSHLFAVNVVSALRAARAAAAAGARRFLYASTGNVYQSSFAPLRESDPVRRDDWYALSKVQAEEALSLLRPALSVTTARLFGIYGPGQRGRLIPNLIASVREGRPVRIEPNPHNISDDGGLRISLCHVADTASVLVALAQRETPFAVNVASDESMSVREIATLIGRRMGRPPVFEHAPAARRLNLLADTRLLRDLLELEFKTLAPELEFMMPGGS